MKNGLKKAGAVILALAFVFGAAGCNNKKEAAGRTDSDTLKVAYPADPQGLDPQRTSAVSTFNVTGNIFEPLLSVSPDWEITPRLADTYSVSEDGKTVTFNLKEGVLFHNGREMTSEDVKFSFLRLKDSESPKNEYYKNIVNIETEGNYTVRFVTETADAEILKSFAYPWAVIVPQEAADTLNTSPVGTGAYKFVEWVPQEKVVLTRFDEYYGEKANIKDVVLKLIPDASAQIAALQVGDVDITEVTGDQIKTVEASGFTVYAEPLNAVQLLALNTENEKLSDARVRKAIAMTINKKDIIDAVSWGYGDTIGSHLPYGSADYIDTTEVIPYDVEGAKALLAEAGYPDGMSLKLALPKPYQIHVDAGQIIADELSDIGINVEITVMEWGEWLENVYGSRDYEMTVMAHSGRLDSYDFISRYHSQSGDYLSIKTGEADELIETVETELDPQKRKELFSQIQELLAEHLAAVYLQTPNKIFATASDVEGFRIYPIDIYEYKNISFKS